MAARIVSGTGEWSPGPNSCNRPIPNSAPDLELDHADDDAGRSRDRRWPVARSRSQIGQTATAAAGVANTASAAVEQVEGVEVAEPGTPDERAGDDEGDRPDVQAGLDRRLLADHEPGDEDRQERARAERRRPPRSRARTR